MEFMFTGVGRKHLEIFNNKEQPPKSRLKAFQTTLEENEKSKGDNQKNVSRLLRDYSNTLYEVCCETLKK